MGSNMGKPEFLRCLMLIILKFCNSNLHVEETQGGDTSSLLRACQLPIRLPMGGAVLLLLHRFAVVHPLQNASNFHHSFFALQNGERSEECFND